NTLGGTCVRVGCIPSKALLESSHRFAEAGSGLAEHGVAIDSVSLDLARMQERKHGIVKSNPDGVDYLFRKNRITRFTGSGRIREPGVVEVSADGEVQEVRAARIMIATGSSVAALRGVEFDGDRIGSSTE